MIAFFENASLLGLGHLFAALSTTEIVVIFLASKPVFVLASLLAGTHARLTSD